MVVPLVAVAGVASCASGAPGAPGAPGGSDVPATAESPPEPQVTRSAELDAALARGAVDHDAYLAGFQRYSACLEAYGFALAHVGEDGPLLDYSIPADAVDSGADDECYLREFEPLDTAWQVANEDTSNWAQTARECLRERGIEPAATLAEMTEQLADAGVDHVECVIG